MGSTTQLTGSGTQAVTTPWISSAPGAATVSGTGLVASVSAGTTVITYTNNNGCSITATVTVNTLPTISGTLSVCMGSTTQLTGSGTQAVTTPWISSLPGVATVSGTGLVSPVSAGTTVITYTNNNGCSITATVTVNVCFKTLTLTSVMLEGLYNGSGTMRRAHNDLGPVFSDPLVADQITVELHNITYSSIAYTATNVNLSTTGTATISVPASYNGSYYITVKHRNHIETTTALRISFAGSIINYAFDLPSKVYGNNLLLMSGPGSHYAIFGGDVNHNGLVESFDMTPIDNLSSAFGYDFTVDVNSDGLIDSRDMTIVDNNNSAFVSSILP
jgi:hypothetical protein